jgi:hypothetical protein
MEIVTGIWEAADRKETLDVAVASMEWPHFELLD